MNKGVTRLVFRIGNYVIKIPNFTQHHYHFLNGCYTNWGERNYCKKFKCLPQLYNKVAPSVFCSWFGLIQIQKYCKPLDRDLTDEELEYFAEVRGGETKSQNFGIYEGRIVCLDYIG